MNSFFGYDNAYTHLREERYPVWSIFKSMRKTLIDGEKLENGTIAGAAIKATR